MLPCSLVYFSLAPRLGNQSSPNLTRGSIKVWKNIVNSSSRIPHTPISRMPPPRKISPNSFLLSASWANKRAPDPPFSGSHCLAPAWPCVGAIFFALGTRNAKRHMGANRARAYLKHLELGQHSAIFFFCPHFSPQ